MYIYQITRNNAITLHTCLLPHPRKAGHVHIIWSISPMLLSLGWERNWSSINSKKLGLHENAKYKPCQFVSKCWICKNASVMQTNIFSNGQGLINFNQHFFQCLTMAYSKQHLISSVSVNLRNHLQI